MNITPNNEDRYKYKMRYKYDEAGNRIRKQMYRSRLGEENWTLYNDEVYIRDGIGNETAIYENSVLAYFNIWGSGLEGKVKKDDRGNTIYSYYYKDHLGSVTAVMDGASGTITQAQDYDALGDICIYNKSGNFQEEIIKNVYLKNNKGGKYLLFTNPEASRYYAK